MMANRQSAPAARRAATNEAPDEQQQKLRGMCRDAGTTTQQAQ
jgi:hypothetical protein